MNQESCIAILAPGLLGGSLALAIRQKLPQASLRIWARRPQAVEAASQHISGAFCTTSITEALSGATLAILCMPVQHMAGIAVQMIGSPDLIVTDVGSVKGSVVASLEPILAAKGITFIGSHPMAGSHSTGLAHARAALFENAACILTPTASTPTANLDRLRAFWQTLGSRLIEMTPQEHDHRVARISHLPHVMAALTTLAAIESDPSPLDCAAGGFRDTTRVAAGDPDMWTGILRDNCTEVRAALQDAANSLRHLLDILDSPDDAPLRQFLAKAKALRDLLPPVV